MLTKKKYRSLDLVKGLAKGWKNLNGREAQVMLYIAQYGRQNEEGFAFVWHPMRGLDWWIDRGSDRTERVRPGRFLRPPVVRACPGFRDPHLPTEPDRRKRVIRCP